VVKTTTTPSSESQRPTKKKDPKGARGRGGAYLLGTEHEAQRGDFFTRDVHSFKLEQVKKNPFYLLVGWDTRGKGKER